MRDGEGGEGETNRFILLNMILFYFQSVVHSAQF